MYDDEISRLRAVVKQLETWVTKLEEYNTKTDKFLFGEGSSNGLVTQVATLRTELNAIKDSVKAINEKLDELVNQQKIISEKVNKSQVRMFNYILTAISIINGLIAVLVALKHV